MLQQNDFRTKLFKYKIELIRKLEYNRFVCIKAVTYKTVCWNRSDSAFSSQSVYKYIWESENSNMTEAVKQTIIKLQKAEEIYAIMSLCTRMPYIECDGETYDDQIFVYYKEEDAKKALQALINRKIPVTLAKVGKQSTLAFFTSLFPLGVNCVVIDRGVEGSIAVQLQELITRPNPNTLQNGKTIVENPELHLTAAYYMQDVKRMTSPEEREGLKELHEEMINHFQKGRYIVVGKKEDNGIPLLKDKNGNLFQPIFTDTMEFQKFHSLHKDTEFKVGVVEAAKLVEILVPDAKGIALNPMGVNVQLQLKRN